MCHAALSELCEIPSSSYQAWLFTKAGRPIQGYCRDLESRIKMCACDTHVRERLKPSTVTKLSLKPKQNERAIGGTLDFVCCIFVQDVTKLVA